MTTEQVRNHIGEREFELWAPLWASLYRLVNATGEPHDDDTPLCECMTALGPINVNLKLARELCELGY